jgi:hypothetical protein
MSVGQILGRDSEKLILKLTTDRGEGKFDEVLAYYKL